MKLIIIVQKVVQKLGRENIKRRIMNRQQRRKAKSKKGGMYRGLKRPTDDGVANGGKKRYG